MTFSLLLFAEARDDALVVECLVDRSLAEDPRSPCWVVDGLDAANTVPSPEALATRGSIRTWIAEDGSDRVSASDAFCDVHDLDSLARRLRWRGKFDISRGHFDGRPGDHAAKLGRKAIAVAKDLGHGRALNAVILAQDMDTDPSRCRGLNQAREEAESKGTSFPIVLACPKQCIEAWVLAAFEPSDAAARERHGHVCKDLGFDPCLASQDLHHDHARHDGASAVLGTLTDGDQTCWESLLRTTPLDKLKPRGQENGLQRFLDEVAERFVPLLRATGH
jgi:hypothetical protein